MNLKHLPNKSSIMWKLLFSIVLLFPVGLQAQMFSGSITASAISCTTTNACIIAPLSTTPGLESASATITLSGSFTATLQFEASADGGLTWSNVGSSSSTGITTLVVASYTHLRVRASALSSGTVTTVINVSTAVISGGGMVYPGLGIALSTGAAWDTSIASPDGDASHFLNGIGGWTAPAGSSGAATDLSNLASPTAINVPTLTFAGAAGLTAGGTNQNITLTPSGTGVAGVPLKSPSAGSATVSAGGSTSIGTFYFKIIGLDSIGRFTSASNEFSATTTSGNQWVSFTWTGDPSTTSYQIYCGSSPGGESAYWSAEPGFIWNSSGCGSTSGTIPSANGAMSFSAGSSSLANSFSGAMNVPYGSILSFSSTSSYQAPYIRASAIGDLIITAPSRNITLAGVSNQLQGPSSTITSGPRIGNFLVAAQFRRTVNSVSCSGTCTVDMNKGDFVEITLTGNITSLVINNFQSGQRPFFLWKQGGTAFTVTGLPSYMYNMSAPGTNINTASWQTCNYDGTSGFCNGAVLNVTYP